MAQTLDVSIRKDNETDSPLSLKIEEIVWNFERQAKPNALPRVQARTPASAQVNEPIVLIVDIGFMTRTITLNGVCSESEFLTLRNAVLNWYRDDSNAAAISHITMKIHNRDYTGIFGNLSFSKDATKSQVNFTYTLEFKILEGPS